MSLALAGRPTAAVRRVLPGRAGRQVTALIGPNGTGKTTLLRIAAGDLAPDDGAVGRSGSLAVMPQFIGSVRDDSTVRDLLLSVSPEPVRQAAAAVDATELQMMADDSDPVALAYAQALADWADVDGYGHETAFDKATVAALGVPYDRAKYRSVTEPVGRRAEAAGARTAARRPGRGAAAGRAGQLSGRARQAVAGTRLAATAKAVLLVSHDRELLANAASRIVTLEPGAAGAIAWVHGGSFATYHQARDDRNSRLEELRRRWDEEHAEAQGAGADVQDEGRLQRRAGVPLPGRADPAGQVRAGRSAAGSAATRRSRCDWPVAGRRSGPSCAGGWS